MYTDYFNWLILVWQTYIRVYQFADNTWCRKTLCKNNLYNRYLFHNASMYYARMYVRMYVVRRGVPMEFDFFLVPLRKPSRLI